MIIRSTSPDVTVPEVSITEYVLRHAERLGDKPAMVDGPSGRTLTYRQLADGVEELGLDPAVQHRDGGGRAPVRRAARGAAESAVGGHRRPPRRGRAAVLERHDRPAQGRHAHAPQPRRQPLPVPRHAELRRLHRAGHHPGRAAVLPHLRHGGHHDVRPLPGGHRRQHAALRHAGVPRDRPEVPGDGRAHRAADRARHGQAPGREPVRPLQPAADLLRRGAARRGDRAGAEQAARLSRRAGLRHQGIGVDAADHQRRRVPL